MKNKSLISIHDYGKDDYFKILEWADIFRKILRSTKIY